MKSLQAEIQDAYGSTVWLVEKFAADMSHEESLAVPGFRANSFNWVLGHMLAGRDRALRLLGGWPLLTEDERVMYETGSEVLRPEQATKLPRLLEMLVQAQQQLDELLAAAGDAELAVIYDADRGTTVGERLKGLHWHETYHLGQLEILRQVAVERPPYP